MSHPSTGPCQRGGCHDLGVEQIGQTGFEVLNVARALRLKNMLVRTPIYVKCLARAVADPDSLLY